MWISELSARSGVPIPTVKFYLREGLLHPGEATAATRTRYDQTHVTRLRLIRALVEIAGLSLPRVRDVLDVVADDAHDSRESIGTALRLLSPVPDPPPEGSASARVARLFSERGWVADPDSPHALALAGALQRMDEAGQPLRDSVLSSYVDAVEQVARTDLSTLAPDLDATEATTHAVIGTLLTEPVLVMLRRILQEHLSASTGRDADR